MRESEYWRRRDRLIRWMGWPLVVPMFAGVVFAVAGIMLEKDWLMFLGAGCSAGTALIGFFINLRLNHLINEYISSEYKGI